MISNYQMTKILVDERQARIAHEADENRLVRALRSARRSRSVGRRSH